MTRRNYNQLDTAGQVRVNAHILKYFHDNPHGFVNEFRKLVVENSLDDRAAGFQGVLDSLRDTMAQNVAQLPAVRGVADAQALRHQRMVLRDVKTAMGEETDRYMHNAAYFRKLIEDRTSMIEQGKEHRLPQPQGGIEMNPLNWLSVVQFGAINVEVRASNDSLPPVPRTSRPTPSRSQ